MTLDEAMLKYNNQDNANASNQRQRRGRGPQSLLHTPGKWLFPSQRRLDTELVERYAVHEKKVFRNSISIVVTNEKGDRTLLRKASSIPVPDSYLDEESAEHRPTTKNDNHHHKKHGEDADGNHSRHSTPRSTSNNRTRMLYKMKGSSLLVPALHKAPIPSLFLQELAHLMSLLSAVAMSTLRNPLEGTESPLARYVPNKPWPPVDADMDQSGSSVRTNYQTFYEDMIQHTFVFMGQRRRLWTSLYFLLGLSRSPSQRAIYNAARPFTVLGGVSDEEIDQLQLARGPSAKVALCLSWVNEFISRECLAGSAGNVEGPLLSDVHGFLSEGFHGYVRYDTCQRPCHGGV